MLGATQDDCRFVDKGAEAFTADMSVLPRAKAFKAMRVRHTCCCHRRNPRKSRSEIAMKTPSREGFWPSLRGAPKAAAAHRLPKAQVQFQGCILANKRNAISGLNVLYVRRVFRWKIIWRRSPA